MLNKWCSINPVWRTLWYQFVFCGIKKTIHDVEGSVEINIVTFTKKRVKLIVQWHPWHKMAPYTVMVPVMVFIFYSTLSKLSEKMTKTSNTTSKPLHKMTKLVYIKIWSFHTRQLQNKAQCPWTIYMFNVHKWGAVACEAFCLRLRGMIPFIFMYDVTWSGISASTSRARAAWEMPTLVFPWRWAKFRNGTNCNRCHTF